jgi:Tfp pilus assembly protein PilZ
MQRTQTLTIYCASRTEEENQIIKRKLDPLRSEFSQMRVVGLHPQGLTHSAHEKMAAVILNVPDWTANETATLSSLRYSGYSGPVLVIARSLRTLGKPRVRAQEGVVFLERPFDSKDLVGIIQKMLHARVVAQRIHRRFNTDEVAEVSPEGRDTCYESRLTNMSKGGAYLEFANTAPLRTGDRVRMKVDLKEVNRVYSVPARVVWTGRIGVPSLPFTVGVEFVGIPNVTKSIIGGI